MGRWGDFWSAHDPDDVFAYDTIKFVTIRDRYLGILHHVFQVAILVYIIAIVIFYQKQFLRKEVPNGIVRIAITNGVEIDQDAIQNCNRDYLKGPPYCEFPTPDEVTEGGGSSTVHVATSYVETAYHKNCSDPIGISCTNNIVEGPTQYVVGNFGRFNITIDHSFQTVSGVTLGDSAPQGYLMGASKKGGDVKYDREMIAFHSLAADSIYMDQFLSAAIIDGKSFDLDDTANDYLNTNKNASFQSRSYRQFGLVILLLVNYDNIENYWDACVGKSDKKACFQYRYEVAAITKIDDFSQQTLYTDYPTNRTTIENRGIRIVGIVSGTIGSFDFQALLIQLTTSLALIKIATTVVDLIAMKLLPRKLLYKGAKYERTEDFSDIAAKQKEKEGAEMHKL